MKICILHNSSPGGASRLVHELATRLAGSDAVTICTWGDSPLPPPPGVEALWCPAPALHLPPPLHPLGNLARSYFGSMRAARTVDECDFDVALVLACQWAQAPEALRRLKTPHLYYAQEGRRRSMEAGYLHSPARNGWRRLAWSMGRYGYDALGSRLDRGAMAGAQEVAANSAFTASRLADAYGISAHVIELGVDVGQFQPAGRQSRNAVALLVGALDPSKGSELAIRSLALVSEQHRPDLRLIANRGDEAYGARMVELGRSCGVRVEVLWSIPDDDLVHEYQAAALLLALAADEPFGLTVLEASACGTPTVALCEGGYRRTVDPRINGIAVGRDPEGIGLAVTEIVSGARRFDPTTMAIWTRERWGWDRCVGEVRDLLEVTSRHGPAGRTTRPSRKVANWSADDRG